MKTKIVISAVNLVEGGPLTILRSCLKALNDYSAYNDVEVLALVHKKELCSFSNITYIEVPWAKNNWIYRIFFEFFYLKKISRKIKPYLWFSLHDTSPNVKAAKRVVYCHNPTPFYVPKMSDLWCNYKEFFFSLFYRYLYQINIHKNDFIVVQQNWLREAFSNMYSLDKKKIIVAVPRSANVQIKHKEKEEATSICKFFFPCYPRSFKNIEVICKACEILEKKDNEVAGFIVEPLLQGAGGFRVYSPKFLNEAYKLCKEHNVLVIFDEVATGFGRTGKMFAADYCDFVPDIMVLGKALTGGYMGHAATIATTEVFEAFYGGGDKVLMHGPTFMGNPLACVASLKSIELFEKNNVVEKVKNIERIFMEEFKDFTNEKINTTTI